MYGGPESRRTLISSNVSALNSCAYVNAQRKLTSIASNTEACNVVFSKFERIRYYNLRCIGIIKEIAMKGSVLGLLSFILFINDIFKHISYGEPFMYANELKLVFWF